jgi:hypothetical protein
VTAELMTVNLAHPRNSERLFTAETTPACTGQEAVAGLILGNEDGPFLEPAQGVERERPGASGTSAGVGTFGAPLVDRFRAEPGLRADMDERVRRLLLDPAISIGRDDVEVVGLTLVPDRPLLQQTSRGTWFLACSYLDDPGLARDGGIAVPESELRRLRALRDAGLSPDLVWLAHELPHGWIPGQALPPLVPAPRPIQDLDATLEQAVRRAGKAWLGAVSGIGAALVVGVAVAASPLMLAGLDPVILAGVRHPTQPVVAWVRIAQWEWE